MEALRDGSDRQPSLMHRVRALLRTCPDKEYEMGINRLVISFAVMAYLLGAFVLGVESAGNILVGPIVYFGLYFMAAVLFLGDLLLRRNSSQIRRILAMVCDHGIISYGLYTGGELTSLLYPIYLWVILGNGFRYGITDLTLAAGIGVMGFGAVLATTHYWQANPHLALGLLFGLVIIPLYAGTLIRKLHEAKRQAENASRAKSLFLASVSHELRTPLNAIIGMSDLMKDTPLDTEQQDMNLTVKTSAGLLLGLIDDLLDFSRLEAGRMPSSIVDFDLHAVLQEVRSLVTAQARAKGLRLNVHTVPDVPYALRGDLRHLKEILINLAGNAVKFTSDGSVTILVEAAALAHNHVRLRFEVIDTGIGIAPEARDRVFESFTQADETILDSHGGTGLGLSICKQLVELQGGSIGVQSTPGAGSTFWFEIGFDLAAEAALETPPSKPVFVLAADAVRRQDILARLERQGVAAKALGSANEVSTMEGLSRPVILVDETMLADPSGLNAVQAVLPPLSSLVLVRSTVPLIPDAEVRRGCAASLPADFNEENCRVALRFVSALRTEQNDRQNADEDPFGTQPSRPLSILVGEDNRTNQKVIAKILQRAGHVATIVENGEEVLDALAEVSFDMVLLDVNMPVMNGIEATKLHRFAALGRPRTPIVALTADATPEMQVRCRDAGMDDCLTKPIDPSHLISVINRLVMGVEPAPADAGTPQDTVAHIASHPRFRPGPRDALDERTLKDLEALGGEDFVQDVLTQFLNDASSVIDDLAAAARALDIIDFREQAHALRSSAANVGAKAVFDLCLAWRDISRTDLEKNAEDHLARLEAEFEYVRQAVKRRYDAQPGIRSEV